jgi:hypothetical protein
MGRPTSRIDITATEASQGRFFVPAVAPTAYTDPELWNSRPVPARVSERASTNYTFGDNGCHISAYSKNRDGYAQIGWREKGTVCVVTAHRAAWVGARGPIPAGLTVDHMCRTRACVNVHHLRLLTHFENSRRNRGRDFPLGQCQHGHDNKHLRTYPKAGGKTTVACSLCRSQRAQRFNRVKQAKRRTTP